MSRIQLGVPVFSGDRIVASMNAESAWVLRRELYVRLIKRFGINRVLRHPLTKISDATLVSRAINELRSPVS